MTRAWAALGPPEPLRLGRVLLYSVLSFTQALIQYGAPRRWHHKLVPRQGEGRRASLSMLYEGMTLIELFALVICRKKGVVSWCLAAS